MGKKIDNQTEIMLSRQPVCHVAYTLNNAQPVRSTIIGEQPLFYMDFEGALDDECDDFLFEALEESIENLKEKVNSYDRFSLEFSQPADVRMQEFLADSALACSTGETADPACTMDEIREELSHSRFAASLMEFSEEHKVEMIFSTQVETAIYERTSGRIVINPNLDISSAILLTVRELRRVWQHKNGVLLNPLTFYPDHAILVNRAQIADLTVSMIRTAWELQLSGEKDIWSRIENSPMADLGRVFAREAYMDFRTINNGVAAAATFETWFLSERCRRQDKILIQQMLTDYQGYVFSSEQTSLSVSAELIGKLGSMPFGKNYLAAYAQTIMTDPVFTDVRDRSNANFLWFIKFEKSFRETEQELQQESGHQGYDDRHGFSGNLSKDCNYDEAATIIAFPRGRECTDRQETDNETDAEIIFFPRWSGDHQT